MLAISGFIGLNPRDALRAEVTNPVGQELDALKYSVGHDLFEMIDLELSVLDCFDAFATSRHQPSRHLRAGISPATMTKKFTPNCYSDLRNVGLEID